MAAPFFIDYKWSDNLKNNLAKKKQINRKGVKNVIEHESFSRGEVSTGKWYF